MNYSNYRITLDVRKTVSSVQLTAKKGDAGRKIYITLSDKGSPCQIKEGCYAVFAGVKPDGTLLYNRTTIEDNTIIYDMTQQTTAVAGLVACEVKLFDSMSNLLTSPKLTILVDDVVVPDDEIVSMDEVTALTELILDASATRELANQIIEECNAAAASANTATQNATTATDNANTATVAANAAAGRAEAVALRAETAATNAEDATEDTRAFLEDANTVLQEIRDVNVASSVVCEETGSVISLSDASDNVLHITNIYGKTTKNGTPTPSAPVALENAGGDGTIDVTVCGKNLFPKGFSSRSVNGITFTPNGDGSVTVSGTASASTPEWSSWFTLPKGRYRVSGAPKGSSFGQLDVYVVTDVVLGRHFDNCTETDFTLTEDTSVQFALRVHAGWSGTTTFYPMVRLASIADGTYESYKGQTLTVSTPNGLPGIPVSSGGNYTDENGQQWICDEIDFGMGKYIKRVATAENLSFSDNGNTVGTSKLFRTPISNANFSAWKTSLLCSHLPATNTVYNNDIDGCFVTGGYLYARIKGVTDANTFNTKMQGAKVVYEMATPIEADLSAEELAQYSELHSNKPNTTVFNDSGAHMDLEYVADTKTYIDNKFNELAAALVNNT